MGEIKIPRNYLLETKSVYDSKKIHNSESNSVEFEISDEQNVSFSVFRACENFSPKTEKEKRELHFAEVTFFWGYGDIDYDVEYSPI